jgi:hypothetical protein
LHLSSLNVRRKIVRAFVASAICLTALGIDSAAASASTSPTDPFAAQQWGLTAIGAAQVWQYSQGTGVTVAVIDSGSGPHPDLTNNLEIGRTFFSLIESEGAADVDLKDGHGTHVAGIIGAVADNGIGIAGVAPKVRLLPVHVLDSEGSGDSRDVARGIRYATDSGARVINLSLGGPTESTSLTSAVQYAVDKGVLVVAASGNGFADSAPKWPAASDLTLAVTSTDINNNVGLFAQRGDYIDIAAPGVNILSTATGGYKPLSGTSMSAAYISGAAALLFSAQPTITATQVRDILLNTATDLGTAGRDTTFGVGLLNLPAAFAELFRLYPPSVAPTFISSGHIGDVAVGSAMTTAPNAKMQWYRCTSAGTGVTKKPADCVEIKNAVALNYQTTVRDLRKFLRFSVVLPTGSFFSPTTVVESGVWTKISSVTPGSRTPFNTLVGTASKGTISIASLDKNCTVKTKMVVASTNATACKLKISVKAAAPFPALGFTMLLPVN